jgi:hypothetical protein
LEKQLSPQSSPFGNNLPLVGGSTSEVVARMLLLESLDAAKGRGQIWFQAKEAKEHADRDDTGSETFAIGTGNISDRNGTPMAL